MARPPAPSAAPFVPAADDWEAAHQAVQRCRGCDLWRHATQAVFGEGDLGAPLMFVGEQPGDREDREGKPFVGPAGRLFDEALLAAQIERGEVYITNAVKHFKWRQSGKRRLHEKPSTVEIAACRPWLEKEIAVVRPRGVVLMGATAARSVLGRAVTISSIRGQVQRVDGLPPLAATVHPSSILRSPDDVSRRHAFDSLVADLRSIRAALAVA